MESIIVDGVEYVPAASIVELQSLLAKHHAALVEQQKPGPWPSKEVIDKAVAAEREACVDIIEAYRIPVGNSAAGEMACEWTYDALQKIRDTIRARGET